QWSKIDFDNKTISVTNQLKRDDNRVWYLSPQLKTATSYRTIKIDDDTIEVLKRHKRQQEKQKMLSGADYDDKNMVCTTSTGGYMKPTYVRTLFNRTIK